MLENGYRKKKIMRFCCFKVKLSKKIEKLSNEQLTHAIAKSTPTSLVQYLAF